MGSLSLTHILLLLVIALIFFGPSRLPSLGKSMGKAIRGFKDGLNELEVDAKDIHDDPPQQVTQNTQSQSQKETEKDKNKA